MKIIVYMPEVMISCGNAIPMKIIEERLARLLESGQPISLQDLGGITACHEAIDVIANSRLMDAFLVILIDDRNLGASRNDNILLDEIIVECFTKNNDPIAIRNAVELLCRQVDRFSFIFNVLLKRTAEKTIPPMARGYFLLGAFEIAALDKSKKYNLISYLVAVDVNEDSDYLKYVSKITGVCYSAFLIEDLSDKLAEFVDLQVGEDEALYELGMCFITKALGSTTHIQAIQHFDSALQFFRQAGNYGRQDAYIFTSAILILKGFINQEGINELKEQLNSFKKSLTIYIAWERYNQQISWVNLRHTEIFYWFELSNYLTSLLDQFANPAWLEPIVIIERYLLNIYDCSRSIFKHADNGSLELLLRPRIHAKFIEQPEKVFLLDQWIKINTNQEMALIAEKLKDDIETYKSTWLKGNGDGAAPDSLTDAVPSFVLLSGRARSEFEKFTDLYRADQTTNVSLTLQTKFNELADGLQVVESYKNPSINKEFNTILFHSLKFLELRMDNTAANHSKSKYLFENKNFPKENVLQNDYFEFMQPLNLNGKIRAEQMDVGGGRADIYFDYLSFSFCTEVKRELKDTSFDALRIKYLGQTKEYQNTSAKVGILLVLDLVPKPQGIGSIESNVKVEITSTQTDPVSRGIVVIKVPGNRVTPNAIIL